MRQETGPAVLHYGFRLMFLAAAGWAIVAIVVWLAMYFESANLPSRFDPMSWHIHEMLFGFVMAAIAGFLLTAIPNWTGRLPVRGAGLAALFGIWLVGRIACLVSAALPAWLAIAADLAFPATLLGVAAREIIEGRNWRNLPMTAPLALFILADFSMHLESLGLDVPAGLGWRLGVGAPIVLISVIGGRIIPSFTRNWLAKRNSERLPVPPNRFDSVAVIFLAAALLLWAALPDRAASGAMLVAAGILHGARLARWAGMLTWDEPLLFILHTGYAWVALGLLLLGLSIFDGGVPMPSGVHALTAGAISVMILAVMPRVTLGHTGREPIANRATAAMFILINMAALARVCASWHAALAMQLLLTAGLCWIAAFAIFAWLYGPMLLTARQGS